MNDIMKRPLKGEVRPPRRDGSSIYHKEAPGTSHPFDATSEVRWLSERAAPKFVALLRKPQRGVQKLLGQTKE